MSLRRHRRSRRRGLSLLEVSVSALLVGVLLVGALRCAGSAISGQLANSQQSRAQHLAQDLLAEVMMKAYEEPNATGVFGPETGEVNGMSRLLFDDVDDYHNWNQSPPVAADGTSMPGNSRWRRLVTVSYLEANDLTRVATADQGVKRITVSVSYGSRNLATVDAIVTRSMQHVPTY